MVGNTGLAGIEVGQAQDTFIATESGGAALKNYVMLDPRTG